MEKPIIVKIAYWSGIPLLFSLILIFGAFIINLTQDPDYYFKLNSYVLLDKLKVDSLVVMTREAGTVQVWGVTKINNETIEIRHGHKNWSSNYNWDPIIEKYRVQNKHLDIWYYENSDDAYFVEPGLEEMTFKTVWLPDLKRLSIVLIIYLFHSYCQRVRKKYELENPEINEED